MARVPLTGRPMRRDFATGLKLDSLLLPLSVSIVSASILIVSLSIPLLTVSSELKDEKGGRLMITLRLAIIELMA